MMDEQSYIDRILNGDTEAYRQLVERYQTGLIIHCENMLKDREDGEDIAQEAFIKAYAHLSNFSKEKASFSTWLYRIATNLCIDLLRKHRRQVHVENIETLLEATSPQYVKEEEVRHLRQLVEALEPPKYAEIIKAYFWEGKSYQELASTYKTSTNTIGTWMSRAKQQLKEKLV
ncbi:MAG TPA: RNA polymerase sigma factor [Candidatus Microsaccharimonas sp.]